LIRVAASLLELYPRIRTQEFAILSDVERQKLADGTPVILRPVRDSDSALLVRGFEQLSPQSRYYRFFAPKRALSAEEIRYFTECDGTNHFAIGALVERPDGSEEGVGVARFVRLREDPLTAEAAVTVIDSFQRKGLGRLLTERLFSAAAERGIERLQWVVLQGNHPMMAIIRKVAPDARGRRDERFGGSATTFDVPVRPSRDSGV
jgi:RimJ/RimL family protein N-acetyltransferase